MYFTIYTFSDYRIDMISNLLKRNQVSSTTKRYKKCTKDGKILGFQDLCKESTRQQIEILKIGMFIAVDNLKVIKLNLKLLQKIQSIF